MTQEFYFDKGQTTYFLKHYPDQARWMLQSKRKNMSTFGQVRFFNSLNEIEQKIKSLAGISLTACAQVSA
jgi:hypothetical protein